MGRVRHERPHAGLVRRSPGGEVAAEADAEERHPLGVDLGPLDHRVEGGGHPPLRVGDERKIRIVARGVHLARPGEQEHPPIAASLYACSGSVNGAPLR